MHCNLKIPKAAAPEDGRFSCSLELVLVVEVAEQVVNGIGVRHARGGLLDPARHLGRLPAHLDLLLQRLLHPALLLLQLRGHPPVLVAPLAGVDAEDVVGVPLGVGLLLAAPGGRGPL